MSFYIVFIFKVIFCVSRIEVKESKSDNLTPSLCFLFFCMIKIKFLSLKQLKLSQQFLCGQKCDLSRISRWQLSIANVDLELKGWLHACDHGSLFK